MQRDIETLVAETARRPVSRISFIRRALALGLSATAAASLLDQIEGPATAGAASTAPAQISFSSWGSLDEQVTITSVLKSFAQRYPNVQVQPMLTSWTNYWPKYNADLAAKSTADKHNSIPGQLADCRKMAEREGWTVVGEFSDEAKSAYHGNRGDGLARAKQVAASRDFFATRMPAPHTNRIAPVR